MDLTTTEEIIDWLSALNDSISTGELSGPSFLKPFHFVTLALIAKKENFNQNFEEFIFPDDLSDYAERMGLWEAAGMDPPNRVTSRHSTDNCMPVYPLRNEDGISDVIESFKKFFDLENNNNDILLVISELLENCYAHSRINADLHGLVCAQQWKRGDLGQIAICDLGIGIRNSLFENSTLHIPLRDKNACVLACEYGITSKPNVEQHHSGYGLTLTKDILSKNGGQLIVVSLNEIAWSKITSSVGQSLHGTVSNMDGKSIPSPWSGTLIVFEWRISRPLDALSVYNAWPKSGEDDESIF